MRTLLKFSVVLAAACNLALMPARASTLEQPTQDPILEVAGSIQSANRNGVAAFDREMLEKLGLETITTTTPWDSHRVRFEGVPMTKLMAAVGAQGKTVRAIALNDYAAVIPVDDFAKHGVILALKRDGNYMAVRDKGPLFVIYPYDSKPELKAQMYFSRSVWQIKRLEFQP